MNFSSFCNAISSVLEEFPDYQIGLIVGSQLHLTSHGIVGMAAMSSHTVGLGLRAVARYISIREPFFLIETEVDPWSLGLTDRS